MSLYLQIASVFVNIFIAFTHNTKKLYLANFTFNAINLLLYLYLRDWPAAIGYIGIVSRSFLYMYRERFSTDKIPFVFCIFHVVFGLATMTDPVQICTIIAPCTLCITMWFFKGQFQRLRIGNIINSGLWFIYNIHSKLYIIAGLRLVTILANVIAFIKETQTPKSSAS